MAELKLNIGCGRNASPGWVNIDNSPSVLLAKSPSLRFLLFHIGLISREKYQNVWPKEIIWKDVSKKIQYPDNSIAKIYSSHFLEHLSKAGGERFIFESFRVLRKDGILRLVVPDLLFHARRYIAGVSSTNCNGRLPHDEFLHNIYGAYLEKKRFGANHRYMYDWHTLNKLLKKAGFNRIIPQEYRTSLDSELSMLDNRPEDSLHIDAVK
jgi:predicted SAM-dependent methyltransferase